MRKIVIASHGKLAEGLEDSLKFFGGESENIISICAYISEKSLEEQIADSFSRIDPEDEILIFTDLLGGSVNRALLKFTKREHVHLITGTNLGLILELFYKSSGYLSAEEIQDAIQMAKESMVYMNQYQVELDSEDE